MKEQNARYHKVNEGGKGNIEKIRRKLHYRASHRGMREMDVYLGCFVADALGGMAEKDLLVFGRLLQIADRDLWRYFVRGEELGFIEDRNIVEMLKQIKASWQKRNL